MDKSYTIFVRFAALISTIDAVSYPVGSAREALINKGKVTKPA